MADAFISIQPLLRDEQFFDPVTGRPTIRFAQYLDELRTSISNIEQNQAAQASQSAAQLNNLLSLVAELTKKVEDLEGLISAN